MLTLQELKQITGKPEQSDKTPSAKYLERHDTVVAVRRLDTDTNITVYKSGYALYRVCSRATVFSLFQCRKYLYESENEEISIGESFFDKQPWYVRLILEGEDWLNRNREVLEHKNCISYSAVSEEWFVLANKMQCPLEQVVLEETIEELLSLLTERQRIVICQFYFQRKSQREISDELGISAPAVSKMLSQAIQRMRKNRIGRSFESADTITGKGGNSHAW